MPFTLAHPAAVLPLPRLLKRFAVPSALVIGSITPDLAYFFPFGVTRAASHSLPGLFWFCMPVGLFSYLAFHAVLKLPLVSLMPEPVVERLGSVLDPLRRLPSVPWSSVFLSLLIGALTHLFWDAFTHPGSPGVRAFSVLAVPLFSIGGYRVFGYKILQHCSTVLGMCLLAGWTWKWLRAAPQRSTPSTLSLPLRWRAASVALIVIASLSVGLTIGLLALSQPLTIQALLRAIGDATISGLSAGGIAALIFSVWWHLRVAWA